MALFKPGESGNPAGRPKGSLNRKAIRDLLDEHLGEGWDPLLELARIAKDPETSKELQVRCLTEIAPYVHARLKQISLAGGMGLEQLVSLSVITGVPDRSPTAAYAAYADDSAVSPTQPHALTKPEPGFEPKPRTSISIPVQAPEPPAFVSLGSAARYHRDPERHEMTDEIYNPTGG